MSISKEERERLQDKCNQEHGWDRAVKLTPRQVSDMLDSLDDADERIAELQQENERLQRVIKNRDNRIRNKTNQLKEVHNRRIAPYTDQIREQGQYIEALKAAREQDRQKIAELEAR